MNRNVKRRIILRWVLVASVLFLTVGPVNADEWDWKVAPYLWTVNIDGNLSVGPLDQTIDMSFSDILSDFDVGGPVWPR